jgi:hypothetical protein
MSTLRSFVAHVLPASEDNRSRLFSKPDRMSQTFELRRLTAEQSRRRPATDFYEYYWAHHMEGTKLRHLWPWVRAVLLRLPANVPRQLRVLWLASWLFVLAAIVSLVTWRIAPNAVSKTSWAALVLGVLFAGVQAVAIRWLGDAARYLSPLPANIAIRHTIRSEGLALLKQLHESGRYDRIVVVGHSLGSVIGYDILTIYWSQVNDRHRKPDRAPQPSLQQVEELGRRLAAASTVAEVEAFQDAQRALWLEQRGLGIPWLVTDFVTLGSPLAHAELLLATGLADLRTRQEQRELPVCPPVGELRRRNSEVERYHYVLNYSVKGQRRSIRVLHHAALFAVTRWSNIYVPLRAGLLGDVVGGPVRPVFGFGIRDLAVNDGLLRFTPLVSHTRYWRGRATPERTDRVSSLRSLCNALDLEAAQWLRAANRAGVGTDSSSPGPSATARAAPLPRE